MKASKYEYTMQLLAAMTSEEIAKRKNISKIEAFDIFMQSETAEMLFNDEFVLWWNGPVYLAEMYEKEMISKKQLMLNVRKQNLLLDRDEAILYRVETKRLNEAVKYNSEKFLEGFIIELDDKESSVLRSKFNH